jgi:transcriptional regulator with XRE-family HTH domain
MGNMEKETCSYQKRIKDLREDHDYTQEYVAHILGTSQTMYARYERGANELPLRHLVTLCDLYGVSADYILCRQPGTAKQAN